MKKFFALFLCCALAFVAGSVLTNNTSNTQPDRPDVEVLSLSKIERTVYTADELVKVVRNAAEEAGFDTDKAESFLEKRWNAIEVRDAMKDGDPQKLNWIFAEVTSAPEITDSDGEHYQMMVKPITAISEETELPVELQIHGYTKYCAEGIAPADLILFPADRLNDMSTKLTDGEIVWRVYAYTVTK